MKLFCDYRRLHQEGGKISGIFPPLLLLLLAFPLCFLTRTCLEFQGLNALAELTGYRPSLRIFSLSLAFAVIIPPMLSLQVRLTEKGIFPEACRAMLISFALAMALLFMLSPLSALLGIPLVLMPVLLHQSCALACTLIFFVSFCTAMLLLPEPASRPAPGALLLFRAASFLIFPVLLCAAAYEDGIRVCLAIALLCGTIVLRHHILKGCGLAADLWLAHACLAALFFFTGGQDPIAEAEDPGDRFFFGVIVACLHALSLLSLFLPSCRGWLLAEFGDEKDPT